MADVLHGNASANQLNATANRTQVYGLAGNDTLTSDSKSDVLLVGGSGSDSLIMSGGTGTLSGGAGADTFELNYSASQTLSAVIEDVDPASDKIVVNFDGTATPTLNSVASGNDVVLSDSDGQLNVTLKGVRENDYFDGTVSDEAWEVLKLTNDERENQSLSPLTMSDGLTAGASVRVNEIFNNGSGSSYISHTRPNGSEWYTALTKNYSASGENLDAGGNLSLPSAAVAAWIGSASHYANIVNPSYQKLGVGYIYEDSSDYEHYWVQLFGSTLTTPETVSTSNLLTTPVEVNNVSKVIQLANGGATYSNTLDGATILGGNGNDSIYNDAKNVSINGALGNDSIFNWGDDSVDGGDSASISGGVGNDYLFNWIGGKNVKIAGGTGNDSLDNYGDNVLIDAGTGYDSIWNDGANTSISGGADSDSLTNRGSNVTINTGAGDDLISLGSSAASNLIQYSSGDGNDSIVGFNDTSTLQIGGGTGTYSTQQSGSDVIVSVGTGSILLETAANLDTLNIAGVESTPTALNITNTANNTLITGTELADTIYNNGIGVTIAALGDNDSIYNHAANVSISGSAGNDTIWNHDVDNVTINGGDDDDNIMNYGYNVTITGGDGDDTLGNGGSNVTITGGAGSDTIINTTIQGIDDNGSNVSIDSGAGDDIISNDNEKITITGGAGNDTIWNDGLSVSITGGTGDDSISLTSDSANNLIRYTSGDGNDTISGINSTSTLQIGGGTGTYSTQVSGSDVIVSVGTGSILLQGAASLGSSLNIAGTDNTDTTPPDTTPANPLLITLTEGNDTYNNTLDNATILALGGNDSIYNSRDYASVSIDGGNGDDTLNTYGIYVTVSGGAGNDSIYNDGGGVIVLGGDGNDSIYNDTHNTIFSSFGYVTIDAGAGNDTIVNNDPLVSIYGGAGSDVISVMGSSWYSNTVNGGADNDSIRLGEHSEHNVIEYTSGGGNDTVNGFSDTSTLQIDNGTGTYSTQRSGNDVIVRIGNGSVLLQGAASLSAININNANKFVVLTENPDSYTNTVEGATIVARGGNDTLWNNYGDVSISGGRANDEIRLSGSGTNSTLKYESGDGNDTVWGGNRDTTLEVFTYGNAISSVNSGNDIIVNVGTGSIRFVMGRIRPPHVVLGASGSSGGTSGSGGGGNSSSGSGGSGSGGSSGSGGTSGSSGSSGNGNDKSSIIGTRRKKIRTAPSTVNQTVPDAPPQYIDYATTIRQNLTATEYPTIAGVAATSTSEVTIPNLDFSSMTAQQIINQRVYSGGNQIISDYVSGEKIIFAEIYTGSFYDAEGNYFVGSSTGALVIQNAADKVIDLSDAAGNDFLKAYSATNAGVIDGRGLSGFEVINGSAGSDAIFVGDGGSQLWGGADVAADTLVGGGGTDIFIGGKTQGADIFANASSADIVHLNDASLSDIVATEENNGAIAIAFNTGNVVAVQSSETLSAAVMLADGAAYRYNHSTRNWQSA